MPNDPRRHLPIAGAHNVRDLGGWSTGAGQTTAWRRILRADSPHRATAEGQARLRAEGLRTVIDLRSLAEQAEAPNPFADDPGVGFVSCPIYDDLAPAVMATRSAAPDNPLLAFYDQALTERGDAVRSALRSVATAQDGLVMFHCSVGKDRTGLLAALLLGTAGVDRGAIVRDYTLTGPAIAPLVAQMLADTRARGGDPDSHAQFLRCEAPLMTATLDRIEARHGSIPGYLRDIGLDRADLHGLRDRLTGTA